MKYALILLALLGTVVATPVLASCDMTVYGKAATAYQYQVLRTMGSDRPVSQDGATLSCGNWWFDAWGSKDISGKQTFGNEIDLTAAYDTSVATGFGEIKLEGYVSYALVPDFARSKDDLIEIYLDAGRPFTLGSAKITPYVRVIQLIGLGVYPSRDVIRSGARFSMPLTSRITLDADAATTSDLRTHMVTARFVPAVRFDAGDNWSFSVDAKFADGLKPSYGFGFSKKF